jgi:hypothetical protein
VISDLARDALARASRPVAFALAALGGLVLLATAVYAAAHGMCS